METKNDTSVLRKMALVHPRPAAVTPGRAFRLALARVATDRLNLTASVTEHRMHKDSLTDLPGRVPDGALLLYLVHQSQAPGLVCLDRKLTTALVRALTTGRPGRAEGGESSRQPTRIDGTLVSGFLDAVLAEFAADQRKAGNDPVLGDGYRCGSKLGNARVIEIEMTDVAYQTVEFGVELDTGAAQGQIIMSFPKPSRSGQPLEPGAQPWETRWKQSVEMASCELQAILHRWPEKLSRILSFAPGDILELPANALGHVELRSGDDRLICRGKLGQSHGSRAVRVTLGTTSETGVAAIAAPSLPNSEELLDTLGDFPDSLQL